MLSIFQVEALLARRRAEKAAEKKRTERELEIKRREDGKKSVEVGYN
jgi:hypothetical protein